MSEIESLQDKAEQLRRSIYGLECSDDLLFSNGSGNLPLYRDLQRQLRETEEKIVELSSTSDEADFAGGH